MKVCIKCKEEKEEIDFSINKRVKTGLENICKKCKQEVSRLWRIENLDYSNKRKYFTVQEKRKRAFNYLGGKCERCGLIDILDIYDYHHINLETKEHNIALLIKGSSWERLKLELDKCMLLCANCHRKLHYEQRVLKYDNEGL